MRVLYLTDSLSDLDGVGRYAMRLVAALERLEPEIRPDFLLARRHRPTSSQVPDHWRVRVALPPDHFFRMAPSRFWPSLAGATLRTAAAARGCDLVHAIKDYPHNLAALLGARMAGVPCVATAHGTYTVQPLLSARHRPLARWAYRRFAAMISVSGFTRRRLLEVLGPEGGVDPERVHVVPNCVDARHYARDRDVGERPWHGVPFTLSIGEIKERKGHHLALEAWCRVARERPELRHFVVGKLPGDDYQARLEGIVRAADLRGRVRFLGNVTEDEKIDLLRRALVFVHTPVTAADGGFEGFGIVYLEAAASGTACLGTRGSGAEDAIRDGETGLLAEQDVASVEACLWRLLDDEDLRRRCGRAGVARAERTSWDANAAAVLGIYRSALGRAAGGDALRSATGDAAPGP